MFTLYVFTRQNPTHNCPPAHAPRMWSDQSAASVMTTSPRHHVPPRHLPPRQMSPVTSDPVLHYPLQHYCAIRKTSDGHTKQVIQKHRTQTNPKPTLLKWPRSRRPTRKKPLRRDRDPLPNYRLGNPPPTMIWHMEWQTGVSQCSLNQLYNYWMSCDWCAKWS